MLKKAFKLLFIFFGFSSSYAQILDDSTKQIYGPHSVYYLLENEVLNNIERLNKPDTLLGLFYKTDYVSKSNYSYQDLGNIGTASKSIFYTPKNSIYKEFGFTAFDIYSPDPTKFKYYNTKSPYTNVDYIQNSNGGAQMYFTHSQNIKPRFNLTLDIYRFNSSKQFAAANSESKLIDHWNYNISSNFKSKNEKYLFLAAFYNLNHLQNEQGGLLENPNLSIEEKDLAANYRNTYQAQINGASSKVRWNNLHVYQQFKVKNGFQIFNVLDLKRQKYFYDDYLFQENTLFYPVLSKDSIKSDTNSQYILNNIIQNKTGIKGRFKGFDYQLFGTIRLYNYESKLIKNYKDNLNFSLYVGGQFAYYFKDSVSRITNNTEIGNSSTSIYYNIVNNISYKKFLIDFNFSRSPLYIIQEKYQSNLFNWNNSSFKDPIEVFLAVNYPIKINSKIDINPYLKYVLSKNYTYFDTLAMPQQLNSALNNSKLGFFFSYKHPRFDFSNDISYNLTNQSQFYRLPKLEVNSNIEFHIVYAKTLKLNPGLDIFYKTSYLADAYQPFTQQFYLQNQRKVWGFTPLIDAYISFKVNRVKLALKYGYVNKGLVTNGYYRTPYYLGLGRTFFLRVNWPLFD